jgi:type IV pilus assembly protein PilW
MSGRRKHPFLRRPTMYGLSMVELLVALAIGSFLMWGAITVYSRSRTTYQVSEQVSRLQENARYAISVLEPDLRLGNYWGLMNDAFSASGAAKPTDAASGMSGSTGSCGTNFALLLGEIIRGDNNAFTLGPGRTAACNPYNNNYATGSDTVTVRRVSSQTDAPVANTLQLYVTRAFSSSQVFTNGVAPGAVGTAAQILAGTSPAEIHNVMVDTYYIDRDSVGRLGIPALRRKVLTGGAGGPNWTDEEVISGVEDLQVQFGIDTGRDMNNDGVFTTPGPDDANNDGYPDSYTGIASQYVNPNAVPATAMVISVRIWLLMRSEAMEPGFRQTRPLEYGERLAANGTTATLNAVNTTRAYLPTDNFRRLVVSRTVQLRNTMSVPPQ